MKFLFLLLAALTLSPSLHAEDQIEVTTHFIEANAGVPVPHDLAALDKLAGVDLLAAPRVTGRSGQKAEVSIERDLNPPSKGFMTAEEKPTTGIRLQTVGSFQGDDIAYRLHVTTCELVKAAPDNSQVETASHDFYATGTVKDGETMWLPLDNPHEGKQRFVLVKFTRHKA